MRRRRVGLDNRPAAFWVFDVFDTDGDFFADDLSRWF